MDSLQACSISKNVYDGIHKLLIVAHELGLKFWPYFQFSIAREVMRHSWRNFVTGGLHFEEI